MSTSVSEVNVALEPENFSDSTAASTGSSGDHRDISDSQEMRKNLNSTQELTKEKAVSSSTDFFLTPLVQATRMQDFAYTIRSAWSPGENSSCVGTFTNFSEDDLLLNAQPLSQKLLACMAARTTDLDTAYACADLQTFLSLNAQTSILLRPATVLEVILKLLGSERMETREGALRCMTSVISGSKEYCQCFVNNNVVSDIFASLQKSKDSGSFVAYACRTASSLAQFLAEEEDQLDALLTEVIPGLLALLTDLHSDNASKLCALHCLKDLCQLPKTADRIKDETFIDQLAVLLATEDEEVQNLAIELFGNKVNANNSKKIEQLPPFIAYKLLSRLIEGDENLDFEQLSLALLECILGAVHRSDFKVEDQEAQFLTELILGRSKICSSKAVDILIVAWDIEYDLPNSLARIDGFLSQIPKLLTVTQAAVRIIHSMIHDRAETCHEMAKVIGPSEIQSLRKQMEDAESFEVIMLVLDILIKMIEQEDRSSDLIGCGVIGDIVKRMDSESIGVRQRCWKICHNLLEENCVDASEECIEHGIVQKCGILFDNFLNHSSASIIEREDLWQLFEVLSLVARLKGGAKAICDVGFLPRLIKCLEPRKGSHPKVFEILINVLEILPVSSSRIFVESGGLNILKDSIQSLDMKVKKQSFQILKLLSFKDSTIFLQNSNLIPELCILLQDSNPKITHDAVSVLCRISRFDLDNVCFQIVESGFSTALWGASRTIPAHSEDYKMLWKIIQGIRSAEASSKAPSRLKQVATTVRGRRTSSYSSSESRKGSRASDKTPSSNEDTTKTKTTLTTTATKKTKQRYNIKTSSSTTSVFSRPSKQEAAKSTTTSTQKNETKRAFTVKTTSLKPSAT